MSLRRVIVGAFLAVAMILTPACAGNKNISTAHGFNGRVYNSVFALYGSSAASGIQDRFVCTVTAYQQVNGGYLLIGAGHCTSANAASLPADMTYSVSEELGGKLTPVALLKSEMDEPLDYAVYFMPTKQKYPVLALGDETKDRIGDKTIDVNFSLAAAKMFSPGTIVSQVITTQTEVRGFFLIDQFDSHGASGSSVVSEKTHKIIGLVIAGWDGETMPSVVEPITSILPHIQDAQALALVAASKPIPVTVLPPTPPQDPNDGDDSSTSGRIAECIKVRITVEAEAVKLRVTIAVMVKRAVEIIAGTIAEIEMGGATVAPTIAASITELIGVEIAES